MPDVSLMLPCHFSLLTLLPLMLLWRDMLMLNSRRYVCCQMPLMLTRRRAPYAIRTREYVTVTRRH